MHWKDEGYLLSKNGFNENSIIIEVFTLNHGKYSGIVYGGLSRKQKKNFQIGNKLLLNLNSKSVNKIGYFNVELIQPIAPLYFDDKKKTSCILSSSTILKVLLPEGQANQKIYLSYQELLNELTLKDWIKKYIYWELFLIKELGFDINIFSQNENQKLISSHVEINDKCFKIPKIFLEKKEKNLTKNNIKEALIFNKNLLMENFIIPNKLRLPLSRNLLENYYNC